MGSIPDWEAEIPLASWPKNQNIKQQQHCNRFNKRLCKWSTLKKRVYIVKLLPQSNYSWPLKSIGVSGAHSCAVENPRLTFDSPQLTTNSLLFIRNLPSNRNSWFSREVTHVMIKEWNSSICVHCFTSILCQSTWKY